MGYGNKIFQAACQELEQRKTPGGGKGRTGPGALLSPVSPGQGNSGGNGRNATGAARAVLSGGDVRAEITQLKDKGLALKEEYNRLLAEHHLTEADVTPQYLAWPAGTRALWTGGCAPA